MPVIPFGDDGFQLVPVDPDEPQYSCRVCYRPIALLRDLFVTFVVPPGHGTMYASFDQVYNVTVEEHARDVYIPGALESQQIACVDCRAFLGYRLVLVHDDLSDMDGFNNILLVHNRYFIPAAVLRLGNGLQHVDVDTGMVSRGHDRLGRFPVFKMSFYMCRACMYRHPMRLDITPILPFYNMLLLFPLDQRVYGLFGTNLVYMHNIYVGAENEALGSRLAPHFCRVCFTELGFHCREMQADGTFLLTGFFLDMSSLVLLLGNRFLDPVTMMPVPV